MPALKWSAQQRDLSVSEDLLAQLDYPKVLILEKTESGFALYQRGDPRATAKERKVGYPQRAMPRLSIGNLAAQELGLQDGYYKARIEQGAIVAEWVR